MDFFGGSQKIYSLRWVHDFFPHLDDVEVVAHIPLCDDHLRCRNGTSMKISATMNEHTLHLWSAIASKNLQRPTTANALVTLTRNQ